MPQFETRIVLPRTRDDVFDFLIRTANLLELIPADSGMRLLSAPDVLQTGSRLEFQLTAFGQSLNMVHEVTELVAPAKITEVQVKGVFKKWVHTHFVEDDLNGHAVAIDRVEFEPPGGMLGFLVTPRRIIDQLESLFEHRHQQMRKKLG